MNAQDGPGTSSRVSFSVSQDFFQLCNTSSIIFFLLIMFDFQPSKNVGGGHLDGPVWAQRMS
jgi:hypothetical protein